MHRSIIPHSKAVDLKENIPGLKSHDMGWKLSQRCRICSRAL